MNRISRRGFLKRTGLALAAPFILPRLARAGNRVTVGMIGMGRQAYNVNLPAFLHQDDVQVVAVCDVDSWRLEQARKRVKSYYAGKGCAAYRDFRELLARPDIDAVMISTPDHWHVPMAIAAV